MTLLAKLAAAAATVAAPGFTATVPDTQVGHWERISGRDGALTFLIQAAWLEGEARERGIVVSAADVHRDVRDTARRKGYDGPSDPRFKRWVRTRLGRSVTDLRAQARVDQLTVRIRDQLTEPAAQSVTPEQIEAYVQAHPRIDPERRRVRIVATKHRIHAQRALKDLQRGRSWSTVRNRYARHASTGTRIAPRRPNRLDRAVFAAALDTPARSGRHVILVTRITPPRPAPIEVQRAQAWEILSSGAQQQALDAFATAFRETWRPRTTCAPHYSAHPDCGNPPTGG